MRRLTSRRGGHQPQRCLKPPSRVSLQRLLRIPLGRGSQFRNPICPVRAERDRPSTPAPPRDEQSYLPRAGREGHAHGRHEGACDGREDAGYCGHHDGGDVSGGHESKLQVRRKDGLG